MEKFDSKLEEFVRKSLEGYEYSYDESQWVRLEKNISGKSIFSPFTKAALIIAGIVILGFVGYYAYKNLKTIDPSIQNNPISNQISTKNEITKTDTKQNSNNNSPVYIDNKTAPVNNDNQINVFNSNNNTQTTNNNNSDISNTNLNNTTINQNNQNSNNYINPNNNSEKPSSNGIPVASIVLNSDEGCAPFSISCNAFVKNDSMQYSWDFGDGNESVDFSHNHTYSIPGSYFVSLVVKNKYTQAVASALYPKPIIVKSAPVTDFNFLNLGEGRYSFKSLSTGADEYKWSFGGSEVLFGENAVFEFPKSGNYTVMLVTSNKAGCVTSISKNIKVEISNMAIFPNSFTPDGDGLNDFYCPKLGDVEFSEFKMIIYNRTGKLIFESSDINNCWDGYDKSSGKKCCEGAYICNIVYKDKAGVAQTRVSSITLIMK